MSNHYLTAHINLYQCCSISSLKWCNISKPLDDLNPLFEHYNANCFNYINIYMSKMKVLTLRCFGKRIIYPYVCMHACTHYIYKKQF